MSKKNTAIQDYLVELRKAKKDLVNISKTQISVGWVDGSKAHQKALARYLGQNNKNKNPKIKPDTSLALIAATLNYGRASKKSDGRGSVGYPAIPARPFINVLKNDHSEKIYEVYKLCISQIISGKITLEKAKNRIGVVALGQLRVAISDSDKYVKLSPATIAKRVNPDNAKPLIDTGTLLNSSDYFIK